MYDNKITLIQKFSQALKIISGTFLLVQIFLGNFAFAMNSQCQNEDQQEINDKKSAVKKKYENQEFHTFQQLDQIHPQLHQQQTYRTPSQLTQVEQLHNELHQQQQADDMSLAPIEKFHNQLHDQQERHAIYNRSTYH